MSYSCPMSFKQIDSNVSRFTSFLVSTLLILYLLTNQVFLIYIVAIDFIIRLFIKKDSSPIHLIALGIKELAAIKDKPVDSGSKRLAAYFGLAFAIMLIIAYYADVYLATLIISIVFLSCSLLDSLFNFCVGCHIYYIIKKFYPKFMD